MPVGSLTSSPERGRCPGGHRLPARASPVQLAPGLGATHMKQRRIWGYLVMQEAGDQEASDVHPRSAPGTAKHTTEPAVMQRANERTGQDTDGIGPVADMVIPVASLGTVWATGTD